MKPDQSIKQEALPQRNKLALHVLLACLSTSLIAAPALAQQAKAPAAPAAKSEGLEEVVITARRIEEKLLEVPISVLAVSEKEIKASGTFDLYDLKSKAGFNFQQESGTAAAGRSFGAIVFRGLQGQTSLASDNSGSLFIDGIFVSSGQGTVNTVDVSRVEVLKGPQNAFFGRSTFGGAVNFITKNPSAKFQGQINTSLNSRGSTDLDATVEGSLMPGLVNGRVTVVNHNKAAMYKASDGGDLGAEKTQSITGTLFFTPSEKLWIRTRAHFQQDDDSSAAYGYVQAVGNTSCNGVFYQGRDLSGASISFTPGVPYFCGAVPTLKQLGNGAIDANTIIPTAFQPVLTANSLGDQFLSRAPKLDHMGMRRNAVRLAMQGGYDLPNNSELAFNIGYNKSNSTSAWDLDRTTVQNFYNIQPVLTHDATLDARYSSDKGQSLRGLIGVSYFTQRYQLSQVDWNLYAGLAPSLNTGNFLNTLADVPAAYGSVEYDVMSNLTLAAETRYQKDKITAFTYTGTTNYVSESKNWLPRVSIKFKPNDDTSVYVSFARGVQPLTLNAGYINASDAGKAYIATIVPGASNFTPQPKLDSSEVGVKQKLFNNRVQYAAAVYNQKWKSRLTQTTIFNSAACVAAGIGLTTACPLPLSGTGAIYANDATISGLEFSLDAAPTPQWTVGLNFDYKKAKWDKYYFASTASLTNPAVLTKTAVQFDNRELGRVPFVTGAVNSTYRMPAMISNWNGYVRGDLTYTGKQWETDYNFTKSDSYYRVNLRVGVEKDNTTLELFVKNVFDNSSWNNVTRLANLALSPLTSFSQQGLALQPGDRRELGLRISYGF